MSISIYDLYLETEQRPFFTIDNIAEKPGEWRILKERYFWYNEVLYIPTAEQGFNPDEGIYFRIREDGVIEIGIEK